MSTLDDAVNGTSGVIPYGNQTGTDDHDHRTNKDGDRTPAQKSGDKASAETRTTSSDDDA